MGYDMHTKNPIPGEAEALAENRLLLDAAVLKRSEIGKRVPRERQTMTPDFSGEPAADADPEWAQAQLEVCRLSNEAGEIQQGYFRLNIWGMASYRDAMAAVGMGYWPSEEPVWPEPAAYNLTTEQVWAARDPEDYPTVTLTPEQVENAKRFDDDMEKVKAAHPDGETVGIPLSKFCSNDGWIVTPPECRAGLQLFGEFIRHGYGTDQAEMPWEDALAAYRKGDDTEREIIAVAALQRRQLADSKVGHDTSSWNSAASGEDDRSTVAQLIAEPYFLDWLTYLGTAARHGGFEVW